MQESASGKMFQMAPKKGEESVKNGKVLQDWASRSLKSVIQQN
jgi:hypothetical protein